MDTFDKLIDMGAGDMLSIDSTEAKEFTGCEDFTISAVEHFSCETGQILVVVTEEEYNLVATDLDGDMKYAICECDSDGDEYLRKGRFPRRIKMYGGEDDAVYEKMDYESSLEAEEEPCTFGLYKSDDYLNFMLLKKCDDGTLLMRGMEIIEDDIVI